MNAVVCKICGDLIRSVDSHDFKMCFCQSVGVDGGIEDKNRVGYPPFMYEILSESEYLSLSKLTINERVEKFYEELVKNTRDPEIRRWIILKMERIESAVKNV